jgi:N-carbamoyl-L-amino-acid hydrolase
VAPVSDTTAGLLSQIADIGRDPVRGGWSRPVFSSSERELFEWAQGHLTRRGLDVEVDRNGVLWGWWNPTGLPLVDAVVTGSHLDSVPGGGAFDGPLGVVSAVRAVDLLREREIVPSRPLAVFPEEEGSRFGMACLGSQLLTGAVLAGHVLGLQDSDGNTFADVARRAGLEPDRMGRDEAALERIGAFVELHVEQGRGLIDLDAPVAVASSIIGHGRWRITVQGQGNHAGTTLLSDRHDPVVAAAEVVLAVRTVAAEYPDTRATVGRFQPVPGGTNVIASRVDLSLDVRHPEDAVTAAVVEEIGRRAATAAAAEGCTVEVHVESLSPAVSFDAALRDRLSEAVPGAPVLATGAGHDAGVLAACVPTAMLFVRNPTGISHSPEEHVEEEDAELGSGALADVLQSLLG